MLSKLIKYEFKATSKSFPLIFAAILAMSLINLILQPWSSAGDANSSPVMDFFDSVAISLYVTTLLAGVIAAVVIIIIRFYKGLLGDQGYLMFTLPATPTQHVLSKLIVSAVWFIAVVIVVIFSAILMLAREGSFAAVGRGMREILSYGSPVGGILALMIVLIIVGIINGILQYYTACALGPLILKNRLGGSILAYLATYIVTQIAATGLLAVMLLPAKSMDFGTAVAVESVDGLNVTVEGAEVFTSMAPELAYVLGACIALLAILSVAYFFITRYLLKRKLNLA